MPTGMMSTRAVPDACAPNAMRAAPVRMRASDVRSWVVPSGNNATISPFANAWAVSANIAVLSTLASALSSGRATRTTRKPRSSTRTNGLAPMVDFATKYGSRRSDAIITGRSTNPLKWLATSTTGRSRGMRSRPTTSTWRNKPRRTSLVSTTAIRPTRRRAYAASVTEAASTHVAVSDCERVRPGFIAQPVNTLSSLAYCAAGVWILVTGSGGKRRSALGIAALAAGVGSVAYHGPGGRGGKWVHDITASALGSAVTSAVMSRNMSGGRRAGTIACMGAAAAVHASSRTEGPLCRPDSVLQGHALWHVLSAVAAVTASGD